MGFFLFLVVTANLVIRPAEQLPELRGAHLYEASIILCFLFSFPAVFEQLTLQHLETRPITICMFGVLIAVILSGLAQGDMAQAWDTSFGFAKIIVYYLLLVGTVTTTTRLRVFLASLIIFTVLGATLAILQYHEIIDLNDPEPEIGFTTKAQEADNPKESFVKDREYDPASGQIVEYKRLRGSGIFKDPNDLALLLTFGIFLGLWGLTDATQGLLRLLWIGPMLLFFYALMLTYSRGGVVSLLAGSFALFYARYGWRGTVLLGVPMIPLALFLVGGRMSSFSASEGTGQSRIQIWSDALDQLRSAPFFGVGMSQLASAIGKVAHNSFLNAFAELGVFGGVMFLATFFFAVVSLLRIQQNRQQLTDADLQHLLPYLMACLLSYTVGILSLSRVDALSTYLLLGLVTAFVSMAAARVPGFTVRLDGLMIRRIAVTSVAFLAATYMIVRVFRA
jgi:hypothetical protein